MFTGIIQSVAVVKKYEHKNGSLVLTIATPAKWKLKPGDSVATDGVCLTVTKVGKGFYQTQLMEETLKRTTFGHQVPKKVNLERSLRPIDFLDGHIVQGHVDAVGEITKFRVQSSEFRVHFPKQYSKFLVEKGSIAVDGISLTVVDVGTNWFSAAFIPYTLKGTTMGEKRVGNLVNLEFDVVGKYIAKLSNG
ncbi:MAG: riboflavin synthase [Candidatus Magasanikbacteria bacterium]|nr:riboflavin synthase [Candidatus Magasanikbacteria bacterium]